MRKGGQAAIESPVVLCHRVPGRWQREGTSSPTGRWSRVALGGVGERPSFLMNPIRTGATTSKGLLTTQQDFRDIHEDRIAALVPTHISRGQELWPRSSSPAGHCPGRLRWEMASQQPRARHCPPLMSTGSGPGCPSLACLCHMPATCQPCASGSLTPLGTGVCICEMVTWMPRRSPGPSGNRHRAAKSLQDTTRPLWASLGRGARTRLFGATWASCSGQVSPWSSLLGWLRSCHISTGI